MSDTNLWEGQFRGFLASDLGHDLITNAIDRHLSSNDRRTVLPVFIDGLNIADSCSLLFYYIQKSPAATIKRCHQILTELGRKEMAKKNLKLQNHLVTLILNVLPYLNLTTKNHY